MTDLEKTEIEALNGRIELLETELYTLRVMLTQAQERSTCESNLRQAIGHALLSNGPNANAIDMVVKGLTELRQTKGFGR